MSLFDFIFKDRHPRAGTPVLDSAPTDEILPDDIPEEMPERSLTECSDEPVFRNGNTPDGGNGSMTLDEIRLALEKIAEIIQEDDEKEVQEELSKGNFTSVDFTVAQVAALAPNLFRDPESAARIQDRQASVLVENLYEQLSKGKVVTTAEMLLKQVEEDLLVPDYLNYRKSEIHIPLHLVVSSVRPDELMKRTSHTQRDEDLDDMPNLFSRPGQGDSSPSLEAASTQSERFAAPTPPPSRRFTAPEPPPLRQDSSAQRLHPPTPSPDALEQAKKDEDPIFDRSRLADVPAPESSIIPPPPARSEIHQSAERSAADDLAAAAMQFEFDDSVSVFKMASSPAETSAPESVVDQPPPKLTTDSDDQADEAALPPVDQDAWMEEPADDLPGDKPRDLARDDAPIVMHPDPSIAPDAFEPAKQQPPDSAPPPELVDATTALVAEPESDEALLEPPVDEEASALAGLEPPAPSAIEPSDVTPPEETEALLLEASDQVLAEDVPPEPAIPVEDESMETTLVGENDEGHPLEEAAALEEPSDQAAAEAWMDFDFFADDPGFADPELPTQVSSSSETAKTPSGVNQLDGAVAASLPDQTQDVVLHGVDLNLASTEALQGIPGIGAKLAARIDRHRTEVGPFREVSGLAWVAGMSPTGFEAITGQSWSAARDTVRQDVEHVFGPIENGLPDLRESAARFAALPGFEGCIFTHQEGHVLAAHWDHPQQEMLGVLAPQFFKKIDSYGSQLELGDCNPVSIHLGQRVITIVQSGDVFMALIHTAQDLSHRQLQLAQWAGAELEYRMQSLTEPA